MRKNASNVLSAFRNGQLCDEGTIRTDGTTVFSYAMPIARRYVSADFKEVRYEVLDVAESPSRTTSAHIRACRGGLPEQAVQTVARLS